MAEAILKNRGGGRFEVFSAGSDPAGYVNPRTLNTIDFYGIIAEGFTSKHVEDFENEEFDIVITVCDDAAESCPVFSGDAVKAHWGVSDPADFEGTEEQKDVEFRRVFKILQNRIKALVELPVEVMSKRELKYKLDELAKIE